MKKISLVIIFIKVILLAGCWDMKEINEIGFVMAVGIDKEKDSNDFVVTVQIADPKPAGTVTSEKSETGDLVWIGTSKAKSIFEAVRELQQLSSKRITWSHNNIVIIGENLAKAGIISVLDFFTHNMELRLRVPVVVSKGDAMEYLFSKAGMDNIAGLSYNSLFRYAPIAGESVQTEMITLERALYAEHSHAVVSTVSLADELISPIEGKKKESVKFGGVAIFIKDKMVGMLDHKESQGVAWILNQTQNTVVTVPGSQQEDKMTVVEIKKIKAKIIILIKNGNPTVNIMISGNGSIVEEDGVTNLSMDEFTRDMEMKVNKHIEDDIRISLNKVQKEYKSDIFEWGKMTQIQHNNEWKDGLNEKWDTIFSQIPVTIDVNIKITDSALNQQPMHLDN